MGIDTLLVILLAWTLAGFLAAIAFGKVVKETSPDEEGLAASAGTVKYFRKNKTRTRNASVSEPKSRRDNVKRLSG